MILILILNQFSYVWFWFEIIFKMIFPNTAHVQFTKSTVGRQPVAYANAHQQHTCTANFDWQLIVRTTASMRLFMSDVWRMKSFLWLAPPMDECALVGV